MEEDSRPIRQEARAIYTNSKQVRAENSELKAKVSQLERERLEASRKLEMMDSRLRRMEREMEEIVRARYDIDTRLARVDSKVAGLQDNHDRVSKLESEMNEVHQGLADNSQEMTSKEQMEEEGDGAMASHEGRLKKRREMTGARQESVVYRQAVTDRLGALERLVKSLENRNKSAIGLDDLQQTFQEDRKSLNDRLRKTELQNDKRLKRLEKELTGARQESSRYRQTVTDRLQVLETKSSNDKDRQTEAVDGRLQQTLKNRVDKIEKEVNEKVDAANVLLILRQGTLEGKMDRLNKLFLILTETSTTTWTSAVIDLIKWIFGQDYKSQSRFRVTITNPFQGCVKHRTPFGRLLRLKNYKVCIEGCKFMCAEAGVYTTPVSGVYRFGGRCHGFFPGKFTLYFCWSRESMSEIFWESILSPAGSAPIQREEVTMVCGKGVEIWLEVEDTSNVGRGSIVFYGHLLTACDTRTE